MRRYKINFKKMIAPLLFWIAGIVLIVIYAPKTTYVNGMVGLGFGILCVSTYWALFLFHKEYDMTGSCRRISATTILSFRCRAF